MTKQLSPVLQSPWWLAAWVALLAWGTHVLLIRQGGGLFPHLWGWPQIRSPPDTRRGYCFSLRSLLRVRPRGGSARMNRHSESAAERGEADTAPHPCYSPKSGRHNGNSRQKVTKYITTEKCDSPAEWLRSFGEGPSPWKRVGPGGANQSLPECQTPACFHGGSLGL